MTKSAKDAPLRITVTLDLPADLTRYLQRKVRGRPCDTYESLLMEALRHMMEHQQKGKKTTSLAKSKPKYHFDKAPLDAFLPQGADPFSPVKTCQTDEIQVDFDRIQSRMDTGRIPKILR